MTTFAAPASSEPIIPLSYTMRIISTRCAACGHVARQSEFLAMTLVRSRMGQGTVKHWTECKRPEYNLPLDHTFVNRITPFCCECPDIDLSQLPDPPHASRLYDIAEPVLKGSRPAAKPQPANKPRLEDLA